MVTTALIGCGPRGMEWIGPALRESSRFRLLAVCDVDVARMDAASRRFGVPGEDLDRLLARRDLQSVVIATSARFHVPVALRAVAAGKHIYVEKPLADSTASARELVAAAQAAGVLGVVGYQSRTAPFAAALKEAVAAISPVQGLLTAHRVPLMEQFFFPDPYGGIMDDTTHTIDLALWAMGGRPEGVTAQLRRGTIRGDATIEYAQILVDFDGGSRSVCIQSSMFGASAALNVLQFVGARGVVTSTDRQTLRVALHDGVAAPGPTPPPGLRVQTVEPPALGYQPQTIALLERFADLVAGQAVAADPPACDLAGGADVVAVMEAAARSATEQRRVALAESGEGPGIAP